MKNKAVISNEVPLHIFLINNMTMYRLCIYWSLELCYLKSVTKPQVQAELETKEQHLFVLQLSCNKEFQEGSQGPVEILPRDAIHHFKTISKLRWLVVVIFHVGVGKCALLN